MNGRSTIAPSSRHSPQTVMIHPTFQKVLLLLVLVVLFDAHYVYKFFTESDDSGHAQAEVGVVHLMSPERGLKGGSSGGSTTSQHVAADGGSAVKKHKLEPSWKADKRLNPQSSQHAASAAGGGGSTSVKKHKLEPSWKHDKRMNPNTAASENEEDHVGISPQRYNSLDTSDKLQELSLEVQLWKGRYEMTVEKLHRLESTFQHADSNQEMQDHELHALMYEGIDVENANIPIQKLASSADDQNELYDPYKTDVFDPNEETYGVDMHILKILRAAGVEIDEELASILPTWEDIVSMYGDKPIISGLETCEAYRENVRPEDRMTGPAGMFNTGTNLLYELMKVNCDIKEARLKPRREPKHNGMRWQAPVSVFCFLYFDIDFAF